MYCGFHIFRSPWASARQADGRGSQRSVTTHANITGCVSSQLQALLQARLRAIAAILSAKVSPLPARIAMLVTPLLDQRIHNRRQRLEGIEICSAYVRVHLIAKACIIIFDGNARMSFTTTHASTFKLSIFPNPSSLSSGPAPPSTATLFVSLLLLRVVAFVAGGVASSSAIHPHLYPTV